MGKIVSKTFGFGMIGCGVISKAHISQILQIENARLVAVADEVSHKAEELGKEYEVDWYSDYRELLSRDDIDIVNIVTPSGMHADITIEAARAGKHVLVEKPMDVTLEKAQAMIQACKEANVKLSIISQHRFDPSTVRVYKDIQEGKLGDMILGQASVNWYRTQQYYDSGEWRGTWALDGGGALMNQSIHTIDLLQYLMGPVESVFAHTATLAHERIEVEDVAVATVTFKNGGLGTIVGTTSAYPGLSARLEVFGKKGTAVIDSDVLTHYYLQTDEQQGGLYRVDNVENLAVTSSSNGQTGSANPSDISVNGHRSQIIDMIQAIEENREPMVNGEEGLKPLEIILAIYQSARTGQPVTLPLQ